MLQEGFDAILLGAMGDPRVPDNRHAGRHPARPALPARPLRELPAGEAAPRAAVSAEGRDAGGRGLRRVPREHRGPVRDDGRQLQEGHARRGRDRRRPQHPQGRRADHPPRLRVRAARPAARSVAMADKSNVLDPRPRPLAARLQAPWPRSTRRSRRATSTSTTWRCSWSASPKQFEVIVTSQHVRRHRHRPGGRRCRAGWGWRPRATSIPGRLSLFEPVHGSSPPLRRQERREPDGRDPDGGPDARAPGLGRGGARASRTRCAGRSRTRRTTADVGRPAGHARGAARPSCGRLPG